MLTGKRRALVLAGGGSRGAYQIGVWKALREQGETFQIITGTSVGALNGVIMVQGDYDLAAGMWGRLTERDVADVDLPEADGDAGYRATLQFLRQAVRNGGADVSPLERVLRNVVNEEKFFASPIDFGMVTVQIPSFQPILLKKADIPRGKLCDYLLATAACFPAFPPREIEGARYVDGSYYDNMPVNLAADLGAEEALAVDLESIGLKKRPKNRELPVEHLRASHPLGPFLIFEPEAADAAIQLGYLDGLRYLGKAEGQFITLQNGETDKLYAALAGYYEQALEWLGIPDPENPERFGNAVQHCAEWYGLDYTVLYTAHAFCYELLLRFNARAETPDMELAAELQQSGKGLADRLLRFGHQRILEYLYEQLKAWKIRASESREFHLAAGIMQKESGAAALLFALKSQLAEEFSGN